MFSEIKRQFNSYTSRLPAEIPEAGLKSGLYSFAIAILLSSNVQTALFVGALGATAAVISNLLLPLFSSAFSIDASKKLKLHHVICLQVAGIALTQLVVNTFTAYRVNLFANIFSLFLLNAVFNRPETPSKPLTVMLA